MLLRYPLFYCFLLLGLCVGLGPELPFDMPITPILYGFVGSIFLSFLFEMKGMGWVSQCLLFIAWLLFSLLLIPEKGKEVNLPYFEKVEAKMIVEEPLMPSQKYARAIIVQSFQGEKLKFLWHHHDRNWTVFPGDTLFFQALLLPLPEPPSPGEFDYGAYLKDQGIQGRFYLKQEDECGLSKGGLSWSRMRFGLRNYVRNCIENGLKTDEGKALALALLAGDRSGFDPNEKADFSKAGAMHLLAVSGMHVGILYLLIQYLFHFLPRKKKVILSIVLIWIFALVTGLGPSVLRSALMFSFIGVAELIERRGAGLFGMVLAGILLLVFNPELLFHAGFQLSFLAVFGILWVYPKLENLYMPKRKIFRVLYSLILVSMVAQLATLPVSLYYFHQFPVYFLLTNLLLLPMVSIWLYLGFPALCLVLLFPSHDWLWVPLDGLSVWVLDLTQFIANLPKGQIENIYLEGSMVWALYGFILFTLLWVFHRRWAFWGVALSLVLIFTLGLERSFKVRSSYGVHRVGTFEQEALLVQKGDSAWCIGDPGKSLESAKGFLGIRHLSKLEVEEEFKHSNFQWKKGVFYGFEESYYYQVNQKKFRRREFAER